MKSKTLIVCIFLILSPILAVQGDYRVTYTPDQVSMTVSISNLSEGENKTFDIYIGDQNSTMTVIIETFGNSGPLWGFFLVPATEYDPSNSSFDLANYVKYADHANYYSVVDVPFLTANTPYKLIFDNDLGHPASPTTFNATFLYGIVGTETSIPNPSVFTNLYLQLLASGLAIIAIIELVLIVRKRFKT